MGALRRNGWVLVAALLSLVLTVQPFRDTDVWWHLAMGRRILASGIPAHEPFSFALAAMPWVGQQWLYEVVLARLVDIGGPGLASLALGAVASAALLVAALSLPPERRPRGPWLGAALLAGALVAAQLIGVRGQVVTLLGVAVVLYVVSRWRRGALGWVWTLPPLFLLWANLHAGFIVGLGICVVALALVPDVSARARGRLAVALGLAAATTLINPAGLGLWRYVAATFGNPTLTGLVAEWQSPDFHNAWLRLFELAALGLAACWFLAPRRDRFEVTLATLALAASLQAQRNVSLFAVIAVPQLAGYGAAAWARHRDRLPAWRWSTRRRPAPPRWFGAALTAVLLVATAAALVPRLSRAAATDFESTHLPMAAATYVGRQHAGERVYALDTWGGYLAERFPQGRVVYVYDETAVFGDAVLQQYLDIHDVRVPWADVITAQRMTVAVLPENEQEVAALRTVGWRVDCRDQAAHALVMSAPATSGGVAAAASVRVDPVAAEPC